MPMQELLLGAEWPEPREGTGTGCTWMMEYLEKTKDLEKYHGGEYRVSLDAKAVDGAVVIDEDVGDGGAAALEALLNQVVVGEESFRTPKKGMVFGSMLEVDEYFRNYVQQQGFGVVRASGAKSGKGMKRNCRWTREFFGKTVRKRKKPEPRLVSNAQISEDEDLCPKRKSKKCDCIVFLYAKVNKSGKWVIDQAHLTHVGHNPTPGKSKNISRFRKKFLVDNPHLVRQLFIERKDGVPVANIYRRGIQMVDGDGSSGYFIGVSGGQIGAGNVGAAIPNSPPTPRSSTCSVAGGRPMFRTIVPKPPTPTSTQGCYQKAATQLQFSQHGNQQSQT
uniref:FAR1 domain-containing protein n=1 Tax=Chenopodium quinoa TaxID=63459 RepID=A0A803N3D9_CHEQI